MRCGVCAGTPRFAVIVSIALAVGANSTRFSLANGLLFRPLPVPNAAELVTVRFGQHLGSAWYEPFENVLFRLPGFP